MICTHEPCRKLIAEDLIYDGGKPYHRGCIFQASTLYKLMEAAKQKLIEQLAAARITNANLAQRENAANKRLIVLDTKIEVLEEVIKKQKEEVAKLKDELASHTGPGSFAATRIQPAPPLASRPPQPGGEVVIPKPAPKSAPVEAPRKDRMELIEME